MRVETICSEVFSVPLTEIEDGTVLNEIESWDSLAHMILITRLEEAYQIQFSGDQIAEIRTVGDVKDTLRRVGSTL